MDKKNHIRRAYIEMHNHAGLNVFVDLLVKARVSIISQGSTTSYLRASGIKKVIDINSLLVKNNGLLNDEVSTFHPIIHGGIICQRNDRDELLNLARNGILPIDMIVVDLPSFEMMSNGAKFTPDYILRNYNVSKPALVRSAIKNFQSVTTVTDAEGFQAVMSEFAQHEEHVSIEANRELAENALNILITYDTEVARFMLSKPLCAENCQGTCTAP